MDTNENIEPVGGQDVSSSQDTSENIAQPAESETVVDGNQPEEAGQAPELLAGKYKSPQELEKAYREAEKLNGQLSQKASLVNQLEKSTGMNAQQIADYLANQEKQRMEQQIQENPGMAAFQRVQQLESQIALQAEERELDKFLQENPDYAPFRDKIFNLGLKLETDKSYDEIAKEYFGNARAQGQQDAYKKIDTKIMTRTTSASQAAPKGKLTPEDMQKMSSAELEAILPHAESYNRPY